MQHFVDAWNDASMRHAIVVHFPIVLSIIGIPLAMLAALLKQPRNAMQWTALSVYVLLLASAYVAAELSGEHAYDAVSGSFSEAGEALLEEHKTLGNGVWMFAAATAVLVAASLGRPAWLRQSAGWLAVAVGVAGAWWIAETAEHGGRLVYRFGAGTRPPAAAVVTAPQTPTQTPMPAAEDPRLTSFRGQVRPLLVDACLRCHSPGGRRLPGGLDLTTIAGILAGGMSGPAIVPGDPDASLLIAAIRHTDPDLEMPKKSDKLSDAQIAVLEQWVRDGAVWEPFRYQRPPEEAASPRPGS